MTTYRLENPQVSINRFAVCRSPQKVGDKWYHTANCYNILSAESSCVLADLNCVLVGSRTRNNPIIAYSVQSAIISGVFDEIMVSTDCEEIAGIAEKYGVAVPFFRSAETSGDYSTTADVLLEVINNYGKLGVNFDTICCIYATAALLTPHKLRDA